MQIDPQSELTLKLTEDGKAYSFKRWTYRQMHAFQELQKNDGLQLPEYVDRVAAMLQEGFVGNPEALLDLEFFDMGQLLGKRYNACFASPEDKKKSES